MIGKYKDFFNFINIVSPTSVKLWEDFNNRPDPKEGDVFNIRYPYNLEDIQYSVIHTLPIIKAKFVKVNYDTDFKNGVAFYYIFNNNGKELKIHSINDVYDVSKLTVNDMYDLFGFWTHCIPCEENLKNNNNESL